MTSSLPKHSPIISSHTLFTPPSPSRHLKAKTKTRVGRLLQSLQLVLYHFEVLDCWHVYLEAAIKLLFLPLLGLKLWLNVHLKLARVCALNKCALQHRC